MNGPVSQRLEQEIRGEVKRKGIVFWLDKDGAYSRFVDQLARRFAEGDGPFPIVGFRGSFLDALLQLEPYGNGLDAQPLLVHLPGFNDETIRTTPFLELRKVGVRYQKALDTLIREAATARLSPSEIERFLVKQPSLEEADAWLTTSVSQSTFGLAAALQEIGQTMVAEALAQSKSPLAQRVTEPAETAIVQEYLHNLTGLDVAWIERFDGAHRGGLDPLLRGLEAWLLCVEYVHDLKREAYHPELRRLKALSPQLVKVCRELVASLRRDNADAYERIADEVAGQFTDELQRMAPEDLGQIDTFREEENRVLLGAVEALRQREWSKAKTWWEARQGGKSFWLERDQLRRWAWTLVAEAASLGETLTRHADPLARAHSLEAAVERYAHGANGANGANGAYEVDRAHRRFEQTRFALLESRLPHYGALREVALELRSAHREWADRLTAQFAALGQTHGFLPHEGLQQRSLFEQVVLPLVQKGEKVAFFAIDAFRYEMATELAEELATAGTTGTTIDLKPRLAELPTITRVGMNALAPVATGGRLAIVGVFRGFKKGEFTVTGPDDRARAMGERSTGKTALLLKLTEVGDRKTSDLARSVKSHSLVIVHSREIDDAGEANVGLPTFESTLRQIKVAWHHLQLAGVQSAVFTADHGFLLQDETTKIQPYGKKSDPQRRYVLDEHPRAEEGMIPVSLAALGYDGLAGHLLFRNDTAVFATGNPGASFVHGGLSPQERVIPVLTITKRQRETPQTAAKFVIETEPMSDVVGLHRLKVRIVTEPGTLDFAVAKRLDVALRVRDREDVYVILKDVVGPTHHKTGRLQMAVGAEWSEIFFGLEGARDEQVRIEIHHPENLAQVRGSSPEVWYAVSGTVHTAVAPLQPQTAEWADSFADLKTRKVFLHIEKHGAITEPEVTNLLGSPRDFRRFSLEFDQNLKRLPFRVRIEAGEGGKRYVREDHR